MPQPSRPQSPTPTQNHWIPRRVFSPFLVCLPTVLVSCRFGGREPKKIGVVLSITGRGATYGQRALNGMRLAADKLNAEEPFALSPIQLVEADSHSSAAQALSAFRKLIDVDRVSVVIGFVLSDEVLTCAPIANARHVVLLTTAAGSDQIADAGDYVFRNRESAKLQAEALAANCIERLHLTNVAILHSLSSNGVSYAADFSKAVQKYGARVSASESFAEGKTDYRSEIERVRSKQLQAVYLAGLDQEMGLILRQAREVGYKPQFLASPGAISQKLLDIAGSAAEGLITASAAFHADSTDPLIRSFADAYTARFGTAPDFIAANSYDAVFLIAAAFRRGIATGDDIKTFLYSVRDFPGVGGRTTFDSRGEVFKPISLVRVSNGRFIPY